MQKADTFQPVREHRFSKEVEGPGAMDDQSVARVEQMEIFMVKLPTLIQ